MSPKHKGLGRGLAALLEPDSAASLKRTGEPSPGERPTATPVMKLAQLRPGRYQPRTRMDETALAELAQSLTTHGMMQPIVVRPLRNPDVSPDGSPGYEIIAGERRFRAAHLAGLKEVPVIVRDVPDEQALAMALIENIQREDLNPIEEAQAIKRLIEEFNYSHDQAATAIGRSRSATSNLLRLLNLAEPVQTMLLAGDLDMGHARALLAVDRATQTMLAHSVVQKRLSVRDTERLVAQSGEPDRSPERVTRQPRSGNDRPDRDLQRLEQQLSDALGTEVRIQATAKGGGKLIVQFAGPEHFDGLLERMGLVPSAID